MDEWVAHRGSLEGLPVELLAWPAEAARRDVLARAGVPRLLLVEPEAAPPPTLGLDEDWVRLPGTESDVLARAAQLLRREGVRADVPYVDDQRVLHRSGATLVLSQREAAILAELLGRTGSVVSREDLARSAWKGASPSRQTIDAAIYRLRRHLSGLSLSIRSVRCTGFVLLVDAP